MTKRLASLWYALLILLGLGGIYWQWVGLNYDNCIIQHRSNFWLLEDREPIHKACKQRLNPFYL